MLGKINGNKCKIPDVDERGPSPLRGTNTTTVGRRSSYVTSRG